MAGKTVYVYNSSQLDSALKAAASAGTSGETIELEPGLYSPIYEYNLHFSSQIVVTSAQATNAAILEKTWFQNCYNIALTDLQFTTAYTTPAYGFASVTWALTLYEDSHISVSDDSFSGATGVSLANAESGVYIKNSTDVAVTNSNFEWLHYGLAHQGDIGLTINDNAFSYLYDDGVRGGGSSNVTVDYNTFTSMHMDAADPDHPDCIQFWTQDEPGSAVNISIVGNAYTLGSGNPVQGIFVTDQMGDLPFENLTIENNTIIGAGFNGITVDDASDMKIIGNTITPYIDQESYLTLEDISSGTLTHNVVGTKLKFLGTVTVGQLDNTLAVPELPPAATILVAAMASLPSDGLLSDSTGFLPASISEPAVLAPSATQG